jgi:putative peptidoglycan lipid II flippase
LLRSNVIVALGTLMSRVTGLVRVAVFGLVIGQSALADAYNLANETPNVVYELLLGGVLSASLVPLFTSFHDRDDAESTSAVVSFAAVLLVAITALAVLAAPLIFRLYSLHVDPQVDAEVYRQVGTTLARIFLVQILFYGLSALGVALLNSRRRYFAAAWSPVLSNLVIVLTLLTISHSPGTPKPLLGDVLDDSTLRWKLGLGATCGIAVMALALIPAIVQARVDLRFTFQPRHPAVQRLLTLSGWTLGYVAANQIAILVIRNIAGGDEGRVDAYFKAFTFFVLPHGLLAMSIATTFIPDMARAVSRKDKAAFMFQTSWGIRLVALLTIPAGVGLFVLRRSIIGGILQHGNFNDVAADNTARALAGFALGLGAFSVYLFVLRGFYAHQDTRTPFVLNAFENLINIVLAIVLVRFAGVLGLGLAFALAYVVSAVWAMTVLSYKVPGFPLGEIYRSIWQMVVAAALMGEAVWFVARHVGANAGNGAVPRALVGTLVGVVVYAGVLHVLGSAELAALRQRVVPPLARLVRNRRRRPGGDAPQPV